jgi:hypothetical protein
MVSSIADLQHLSHLPTLRSLTLDGNVFAHTAKACGFSIRPRPRQPGPCACRLPFSAFSAVNRLCVAVLYGILTGEPAGLGPGGQWSAR